MVDFKRLVNWRYFPAALVFGAVLVCLIFLDTKTRYQPRFATETKWQTTSVPGLLVDGNRESFGVVAPGARPVVKFMLRNVGRRPIHIKNILVQCSCEATRARDEIIRPGELDTLRVSVKAPAISGTRIQKFLWIFFTKPGMPNLRKPLTLRVFGSVGSIPPLTPLPALLQLTATKPGGRMVGTVYLQGQTSLLAEMPDEIKIRGKNPAVVRLNIPAHASPIGYSNLHVEWRLPDGLRHRNVRNSLTIMVGKQRVVVPLEAGARESYSNTVVATEVPHESSAR